MQDRRLRKQEKLKSRKAIDQLFKKGRRFAVFPLLTWYIIESSEKPGLQIGVSASKRSFKRAVDRNRVKRVVREAYRLQKSELVTFVQTAGLQVQLFFIYTDKALPSFEMVSASMEKTLSMLQKKLTHEQSS